ncbi:MAG: SBBP repeat-containing protein [Bradymonadales bacterium]|nr:SBBP repeat-containing protein [Bradymonadales bacterium]
MNYLIGNQPDRWQTNVSTFEKVRYREVYHGIDVVFYGNPRQVEYDFVVSPGADPEVIQLAFEGADRLEIDEAGNLVASVNGLAVLQRTPVVYQERDGARSDLDGRYVLLDEHHVGFVVEGYDRELALVIDPVLQYSTYLGGAGYDEANGIAVDIWGNLYQVGVTYSTDFPTTDGVFTTELEALGSVFVTKLSADGSSLVYSTYVGGTEDCFGNPSYDYGLYLAIDRDGNAYVGADTSSIDFPTTPGAIDQTLGGYSDGLIFVLDPFGTDLLYATYVGGEGTDFVRNLAIRGDHFSQVVIYAEGGTDSPDFPVTDSAYQGTLAGNMDAFVLALDPSPVRFGGGLLYSSYLGGEFWDIGHAIAVDREGLVYIAGRNQSVSPPPSGVYWHPDTYGDRGVMWCGADDSAWSSPPGYGNYWNQALTKAFDLPSGDIRLVFEAQWDTEWDFDFGWVQVSIDGGDSYDTLLQFSGGSAWFADPEFADWYIELLQGLFPALLGIEGPDEDGFVEVQLALSDYSDQEVLIRFLFTSDVAWSDEDGFQDTDGAVRLDSVEVAGTVDTFDDHEGNWIASDGWEPPDPYFPADFYYGPRGFPEDNFVAKFDPTKSGEESLIYSVVVGGSAFDNAAEMAVDDRGNAYVVGITQSPDFPTTPGALDRTLSGVQDAYLLKLNPNGSRLVFSTYIGGEQNEIPYGISVDFQGKIYLSGHTSSQALPFLTSNAIQTTLAGPVDGMALVLNPNGSSVVFGTYFGGSGQEIWGMSTLDGYGDLYLSIQTLSDDFPVTPGAYDTTYNGDYDQGVLKLELGGPRIVLCHYPAGDHKNGITIVVDRELVWEYLLQGDSFGPCQPFRLEPPTSLRGRNFQERIRHPLIRLLP